MNSKKFSSVNLPLDLNNESDSRTTASELIVGEKEQQTSSEKSNLEDAAASGDMPMEEYPAGKELVPILLALMCAMFLIGLDTTIIGTAIPKITAEFDGLSMVSWYGSVYFMTFGGFQPASGKYYKYFPLKASFLSALSVFLVGSIICAVSQGSTTFIVGRAIAGVGAAGVSTGAWITVAFTAEPKARPGLIGLLGACYGLSSAVGPILGGVFTDKASWRWCFYINPIIGGLSAILLLLFFRSPPQAKAVRATWKEKFLQMDPLGATLIMGGIISFILAVEYGGQKKPWNSSTVIGLLAGTVSIWIAFVFWECFNSDRAMLQCRLLGLRYVWMPSAFQCFFAASYFILLYYLPIYFQGVDNRTAISSGVLNLPLVLAMVVGNVVSGIAVSKTGHAAPFVVVGAAMAAISAGLMYTYNIETSMGRWIGYQIMYGAGAGLGFQMGMTIAQANAKSEDMSTVTATVCFFQTIGGAFSLSAAQSGFVNRMVIELAKLAPEINSQTVIGTGATHLRIVFPGDQIHAIVLAYMAGIKVTFALSIALIAVACLISVFVPRKPLNVDAMQGGTA